MWEILKGNNVNKKLIAIRRCFIKIQIITERNSDKFWPLQFRWPDKNNPASVVRFKSVMKNVLL